MAEAADDGYGPNNSADLQMHVDNIVDLAVLVASGGSGLEDQDIEGQVTLRSGGRESAANATLDIEVHAAGVLRGARIVRCRSWRPMRSCTSTTRRSSPSPAPTT